MGAGRLPSAAPRARPRPRRSRSPRSRESSGARPSSPPRRRRPEWLVSMTWTPIEQSQCPLLLECKAPTTHANQSREARSRCAMLHTGAVITTQGRGGGGRARNSYPVRIARYGHPTPGPLSTPPATSAPKRTTGVATRLLYPRGSLGGSPGIRTRKGAGDDRTERAGRVAAGRDQPTHQGDLGDTARAGPAAAHPFEGGHAPAARQGGTHRAG